VCQKIHGIYTYIDSSNGKLASTFFTQISTTIQIQITLLVSVLFKKNGLSKIHCSPHDNTFKFRRKFEIKFTIRNSEHYLMTLADIQSLQVLASLSKNSQPSWSDLKAAKHFKNP